MSSITSTAHINSIKKKNLTLDDKKCGQRIGFLTQYYLFSFRHYSYTQRFAGVTHHDRLARMIPVSTSASHVGGILAIDSSSIDHKWSKRVGLDGPRRSWVHHYLVNPAFMAIPHPFLWLCDSVSIGIVPRVQFVYPAEHGPRRART